MSAAPCRQRARPICERRSGEGRVGEECRFRWAPDHLKKKKKTTGRVGSLYGVKLKRQRTVDWESAFARVCRPRGYAGSQLPLWYSLDATNQDRMANSYMK